MNIHEYQAKEILKKYGAPVSNGVVIFSLDEIRGKVEKLKSKHFVLKAQIHAGGRGKGGGVKLIKSLSELEKKVIENNNDGGVYCVIIEPYSASLLESCSDDFIKKLFELKVKYKFKIIFDEVFTGFYKSKKMFYFQNFPNITPDIDPLPISFP